MRMIRKLIYLIAPIFMGAIFALFVQQRKIKQMKRERIELRSNQAILMQGAETFKFRDSLNAARISALKLSLAQYERYKAEDAKLIKELTKGRNVEASTSVTTITETPLSAIVHDTIFRRDTALIEAQSIEINDHYITMSGLIVNKRFKGTIAMRDTLLLIESVKHKRFLGFLWKLKAIKSREYDVVSKNPYTQIKSFEVVQISK